MDSVCRVLVVLSGILSPSAGLEVIDMTLVLAKDTINWPGSPPFNFTILKRGYQTPGFWYEINYFGTAEHAGTHVDAPAHFSQSGWRVHQIPPSSLAGPAVVVDVADKATKDADYRLTIEDLQSWEDSHGRIPNKAVVVMYSGWGARYPSPSRVYNTNNPLDASTFHFPGIHPAAAAWLASQRHVIAVGVDTPSTDYGQSTKYETHVVLGNNNVLGLENLQNVDQLPARGATIAIGLVNLKDGSGGPARILAIIDSTSTTQSRDSIERREEI
ncbi:hypothetical protein C0Q70_15376 [Pomacea canaliculata]|uniref:Cyclase n=1 Tax=Pomacea canaliculata TaxID=400727 RepID=A0A2T7NUR4_POMCA|nr:uncharacterized protein LOC112572561 [Pomacea canaliculata]XP_025108083.1 uncharacterized protein LOC112572561 [Pomacea canaliculata]PVD24886.1 hypothetical protein C0Q70_15376 [Pomacea canaliculata]